MGIFQKGMNPGAYSGQLNCPTCASSSIRFVEQLGPYRLRYRCRKCGLPFQYETGHDLSVHPYAPLKKRRFQDIVSLDKLLRGRKTK